MDPGEVLNGVPKDFLGLSVSGIVQVSGLVSGDAMQVAPGKYFVGPRWILDLMLTQ